MDLKNYQSRNAVVVLCRVPTGDREHAASAFGVRANSIQSEGVVRNNVPVQHMCGVGNNIVLVGNTHQEDSAGICILGTLHQFECQTIGGKSSAPRLTNLISIALVIAQLRLHLDPKGLPLS